MQLNFIQRIKLISHLLRTKTYGIPLDNAEAFNQMFKDWLDNVGGGSKNTGYIASCIDVWGLNFAGVKFRVYDKANKDQEVEAHPASRIFEKPNWFQTWWEISYRIASDFSYWGNSYLLKLRDGINVVQGLVQLHPDRIKTYPYNVETIEHYEYQQGTSTGNQIINIPPEEIIHLRYPASDNYISGTPILAKIADLREIEKMQMAYRKAFYKKGGLLGATFSTDQALDTTSFDRAKEQLITTYGGHENAYAIALFEKGIKPVPTAYSLKDMQMKEERELNRDEILSAWKVNKLLLGQSEMVQRGNAETVFYIFASMVIDPLMDYIDQCLTSQWVAVDYEPNDYIKHDQVAARDTEMDLKYYQTMHDVGALNSKQIAEAEGWEYKPVEQQTQTVNQNG